MGPGPAPVPSGPHCPPKVAPGHCAEPILGLMAPSVVGPNVPGGLLLGSGGGRDLLLFEPFPRWEIWQNPKGNGDGTGEESNRGLLRKSRGGRWHWAVIDGAAAFH